MTVGRPPAGGRPARPGGVPAPLLSVRGVRKAFGGIVALDDVSLDVAAGRITAVIGPNGAGKTTLFNIVAGVYPPDRGTVAFDGAALERRAPHRMAQVGLVRTFQNVQPFANMTVLDNVAVGRHSRSSYGFLDAALKLPRARAEEDAIYAAARAALGRVKLADQADLPCSSLPAGRQRLLAVARALAAEPRLLLLDEPAAGLNRTETAELAALVRQLVRDDGITVLLVEHDMGFVMSLADRIVVLDYGKKIAEGAPDEVRTDPRVIEAYLGGADSDPPPAIGAQETTPAPDGERPTADG